MTDGNGSPVSRAEFHQQHQADALAQAERLLARREDLQGAWLNWVAGELYRLGPPPYAAMVRRELQRLSQG
ncbi:hypothetical protein OGV25_07695 [Pseudomonas sp. P1B16]|jgi:hypothetical protein|uniref:Uncharacterized protein n=1 Tax=Pseudomonas capeferrum TaxID=1495066 RepID=A0ABY7RE44_9PSED|nr:MULTISPECIES: hypothetical protein [Pseudomonas]KEY86542.1 hypothetical protein PC358_12790 [Pseudomonas capeferrum]KGI90736.1 hypothetical protein MD26_24155 [Pseudomonas sp. H2]MBC3483625.1 hypothetical protein [Pseudomonas sp. SWRI77]MBC3504254.1 hypothetical protein [Pseudomonas sp. SWRI59]MBC3509568.1 hypothetical protein [Pseudomonas sp. SWRI68]